LPATLPIAPTALRVDDCTAAICDAISSVAGGLDGKRLDLGGDDRKTLAGGAGAGRFDRGIQGQQIRLSGDALDQLDHIIDLARGLCEAGDLLVGRLRLGRGGDHHLACPRELSVDLADRF